MKNIDNKIQVLKESLSEIAGNMTLREYVENEKAADPGFMNWLFDDPNLDDYGSNMSDEQEQEFQEFLSKL